ncbi:MAG: NACHT domain-containing protein [Anaerolineales bacterium]|nr:NACHT domain-containing protein [Anaerolineales bacterium]
MERDIFFRPERFIEKQYLEERTLSDRKLCIPLIKDDIDKRAEFIRDLIALANASRERGKPAYILFGVRDNWDKVGIEGQSVQAKLPIGYNPNDDAQVEHLQRKVIEKAFIGIATQYIAPKVPSLEYYHGLIDGVRFSYLEICAEALNKTAYEVAKDLLDAQAVTQLKKGDCFTRRGESKIPVSEEEKPFLYSWTNRPYIDNSQWRNYINQLKEGGEFENLEDVIGRQFLYANNDTPLEDEVKVYIESPPGLSLLIIRGQPGCGKSVFLQDQTRKLATNLIQELESNTQSVSFKNPIPIFQSLNDFSIKPGDSLERELIKRLREPSLSELQVASEPEKVFQDKSKKWVILLDAFDEVAPELQSEIWREIRRLASYPQDMKIILTVRPDVPLRVPKTGVKEVTVAPLKEEQIWNYLRGQIESDEKEKIVKSFFATNNEIWRHLEVPLFLKTAATYFNSIKITSDADKTGNNNLEDNANTIVESPMIGSKLIDLTGENLTDKPEFASTNLIRTELLDKEAEDTSIRMGIFLDKVFHLLWKHNDEKKRLVGMDLGDLDETYEALGEMVAKKMVRREKVRIREAEVFLKKVLNWILDLGILFKSGGRIFFLTSLAKIYFAAFFLRVLLEEPDELNEIITNTPEFWEKCLSIVRDFASMDKQLDISPLIHCVEILKGEQTNG